MSVAGQQQLASGARNAVIFQLDPNGYPLATSPTTAYEGFQVVGLKAYTLSIPASRKMVHDGDDTAIALDFLPPTDAITGELQIASDDLLLNAMLTNVKQFTLGEASLIPWATDQRGYEPQVSMLCFQQSLITSTKLRNWRFHMLPRVKIIPQAAGMDANVVVGKYEMAPSPSTLHIWGTAMTTTTEGATQAAIVEGQATNKPKIIAFKGNNVATVFSFPTSKPCADTTSIVVWVNGVLKVLTTDYTVTTTAVTFVAAPANNAMVVIFYEY